MPGDHHDIELSIIAPAHNEQENIARLLGDVADAMLGAGVEFEMIVVDDGSTDGTRDVLREQMAVHPWLRVFYMLRTAAGRGHGQSAAFHAGIREGRGELIAL